MKNIVNHCSSRFKGFKQKEKQKHRIFHFTDQNIDIYWLSVKNSSIQSQKHRNLLFEQKNVAIETKTSNFSFHNPKTSKLLKTAKIS